MRSHLMFNVVIKVILFTFYGANKVYDLQRSSLSYQDSIIM